MHRLFSRGACVGAICGYFSSIPGMYLFSLLCLGLNNYQLTAGEAWAQADGIIGSVLLYSLVGAALGAVAGSADKLWKSVLRGGAGAVAYFSLYVVPFQLMTSQGARDWLSSPASSETHSNLVLVAGLALLGLGLLLTGIAVSGMIGRLSQSQKWLTEGRG